MYTQTPETQASLTPADALKLLMNGNARFLANDKSPRNHLDQVADTQAGQWPFAVILSCIDSRTSVELVFDQAIGDVFSARVAGNFANEDILGSMEFACHVAGAKLVVVLGHSDCGAVKGACDKVELGNLTGLLRKIEPAVEAVKSPSDPSLRNSSNAEFVQAVALENVLRTMKGIATQSDVLRELRNAGAIEIVGAMYDISTGGVKFLDC